MFKRTVTVKIEFPALDALVAYLKQRDDQQQEVDQIRAQVEDLTQALSQSTSGLQAAVQTMKQENA